MVAAFGKPIGG